MYVYVCLCVSVCVCVCVKAGREEMMREVWRECLQTFDQ